MKTPLITATLAAISIFGLTAQALANDTATPSPSQEQSTAAPVKAKEKECKDGKKCRRHKRHARLKSKGVPVASASIPSTK